MNKKYPFFFNREPIKFISEFQKPKKGSLKCRSKYLNGMTDVKLVSNKNEFKITFEDFLISKNGKSLLGKIVKNVVFKTDFETLSFQQVYIDSLNTGIVTSISRSLNRDSTKYYKVVVPLKKELKFHFQLTRFIYSSENWQWSTNGTMVSFEDEEIYILIEKDEKKKSYLIIESNKKQTFEEFSDKVFAVRVSLGYLIGVFVGGKAYFYGYGNKRREKFTGFVFYTLRDDIKTLMQPINSNPYAWTRAKKVADGIYKRKDLRSLTIAEFSKLCRAVLLNDNLLATLLLIIESSNASLIFRPSGYAIALETLADVIIGSKLDKISPITSKSVNREFRKSLNTVLDDYVSNPSFLDHFNDVETLRGRINNINQLTNKERLRTPFKLLGIDLLEEDLKVIASRNDFLHGRVPDYKGLGINRSISLKDYDLFYASVRLYTLLNMLILKFIGYDNYVLNFAKLNEKGTNYSLDEGYYRKV